VALKWKLAGVNFKMNETKKNWIEYLETTHTRRAVLDPEEAHNQESQVIILKWAYLILFCTVFQYREVQQCDVTKLKVLRSLARPANQTVPNCARAQGHAGLGTICAPNIST
jgi:hypothetical protein